MKKRLLNGHAIRCLVPFLNIILWLVVMFLFEHVIILITGCISAIIFMACSIRYAHYLEEGR